MCGLFTECSIADGDIQHAKDLKPTNVTGFFYYPISCNGTLVSINAHGFCPKTNMSVVLVFYIANIQDNTYINIKHRGQVLAECDTVTSTAISSDGLEYYKGNISTGNQIAIKVSSGEYLAIGYYESTCWKSTCFFLPAIVNESSKHMLHFTKNVSLGEVHANTSLLFSATFLSGEAKLTFSISHA